MPSENNNDNALRTAKMTEQSIINALKNAPFDGTKKYALLKKGDALTAYHVFGQCAGKLKLLLDLSGIPFLVTADRYTLVVRLRDLRKIREKNRQALEEQIRYAQDMGLLELKDMLDSRNEKVFTIHGLSPYEAVVLKNNCSGIRKGFPIGISIDPDSGMADVSVSVNDVNKDFMKAYIRMELSVSGPTSYELTEAVDRQRHFEETKKAVMSSNRTVYVNSLTEKGTYLEAGKREFTLHREGKPPYTYDGPIEEYEDRLDEQLYSFFDTEVVPQERAGQQTMIRQMPEFAPIIYTTAVAETKASDIITKLIENKILEKGITFDDAKDMFDYYLAEGAKAMQEVLAGQAKTYPEKEIKTIGLLLSQGIGEPASYKDFVLMLSAHGFGIDEPEITAPQQEIAR